MRVSTGIQGLDKMLLGGFIPKRNILLSGPSGAGKSTIACHFLLEGKEPSIYITLEEPKAKIIENMLSVGLDMKAEHIHFLGGPLAKITGYMKKVDASPLHILEEIERVITEQNIHRVVIDSINLLMMIPKTVEERRETLAQFCNILSSKGCTALLLCEIRNETISEYGIEEFIADGVVVLDHVRQGPKMIPSISIRKLRGSQHDRQVRPYKITDAGIVVYHEDTVFT